jgi:hypothetical protein
MFSTDGYAFPETYYLGTFITLYISQNYGGALHVSTNVKYLIRSQGARMV